VTGQTPVAGSPLGVELRVRHARRSDLYYRGVVDDNLWHDQLGEMTSAAAGQTSTYKYTGGGLEAAMNSGGTTVAARLEHDRFLALVLSDGTNDYVYGSTTSQLSSKYHLRSTDGKPAITHLHRPRLVLDGYEHVRATVSFYRYDAYGTLALARLCPPFGFAGQYTDSSSGASGFVNMRAGGISHRQGSSRASPIVSETDQAYEYAETTQSTPVTHLGSSTYALVYLRQSRAPVVEVLAAMTG